MSKVHEFSVRKVNEYYEKMGWCKCDERYGELVQLVSHSISTFNAPEEVKPTCGWCSIVVDNVGKVQHFDSMGQVINFCSHGCSRLYFFHSERRR